MFTQFINAIYGRKQKFTAQIFLAKVFVFNKWETFLDDYGKYYDLIFWVM